MSTQPLSTKLGLSLILGLLLLEVTIEAKEAKENSLIFINSHYEHHQYKQEKEKKINWI